MDAKSQTMHLEHDVSDKGDDVYAGSSQDNVHSEHVHVSEADDKRLCRKTDLNLLPVLIWVYILQILDKQVSIRVYKTPRMIAGRGQRTEEI